MMQWQNKKFRFLLRGISFLTIFVFTLNTITWADGGQLIHARQNLSGEKLPLQPKSENFFDSIYLPESIGQIKKTFQGSRDRIVIHIQEAHVNEEAQRNIANILDYFASKHDLKLVNLGGAEGDLRTDVFSFFPIKSGRNLPGFLI